MVNKKGAKTQTQLPRVEPVPMTIEEIEEDLTISLHNPSS